MNFGSEARPCNRHSCCHHGYTLLKSSYMDAENGSKSWEALVRDGAKLREAVAAVRPPPGTDFRTKVGKQARSEAERKCKKYTEIVRTMTAVSQKQDIIYLSRREYIQHWKNRVGCTDEEAEEKWQNDMDNIDIDRMRDEAEPTEVLIAVRQPPRKTGSQKVQHEQMLELNKVQVQNIDDMQSVQRRMGSHKRATNRIFAKMGNECFRTGAASSSGALVSSGEIGRGGSLFDLDMDDGADLEPPMKKARLAPCESSAGVVSTAANSTDPRALDDGSLPSSGAAPGGGESKIDSVAFTKTRMELVARSREMAAAMQSPKGIGKTCQKLVEHLGTDNEEVSDLEAVSMLEEFDRIAKELAKVQVSSKSWTKHTYEAAAARLKDSMVKATDLQDRLSEVAEVLQSVAKSDKQDKTAQRRRERRAAGAGLTKIVSRLQGGGFPAVLATRMAPVISAASCLDEGAPDVRSDSLANGVAVNVDNAAFLAEVAGAPSLWTAAFLRDTTGPQVFGQVMVAVKDKLETTGMLAVESKVLAQHMEKHKAKGNNVCFDPVPDVPLQFGGESAESLGTPACSAPWLVRMSPDACLFGPSSFPLVGIGSLYMVAHGTAIVYMQNMSTIPGTLSMYMEFLRKEDATADSCSNGVCFAAFEGDVFWLPYCFIVSIMAQGSSPCTVIQQPWFSKSLARGTDDSKMGQWALAKAWQTDFMNRKASQTPWSNIAEPIKAWMP